MSMCFRRKEIMALSRVSDRIAKAMSARLRLSISVSFCMAWIRVRICASVGQVLNRRAVAIPDRLSGALKYSASAYLIREAYPGWSASQTKKALSAARVAWTVDAERGLPVRALVARH